MIAKCFVVIIWYTLYGIIIIALKVIMKHDILLCFKSYFMEFEF